MHTRWSIQRNFNFWAFSHFLSFFSKWGQTWSVDHWYKKVRNSYLPIPKFIHHQHWSIKWFFANFRPKLHHTCSSNWGNFWYFTRSQLNGWNIVILLWNYWNLVSCHPMWPTFGEKWNGTNLKTICGTSYTKKVISRTWKMKILLSITK